MRGTSLVVGDVVLSAGWGTGRVVTVVTGDDSHGTIRVHALGVGFSANPTITLTFTDLTWTVAPFAQSNMGPTTTSALDMATPLTQTTTTTTLVLTFRGTPVVGRFYEAQFQCFGRGA
jgi:hypothetical protein